MSSVTDTFNNVTQPLVALCYGAGNDKMMLTMSLTELKAAADALSAALAAQIAALPGV